MDAPTVSNASGESDELDYQETDKGRERASSYQATHNPDVRESRLKPELVIFVVVTVLCLLGIRALIAGGSSGPPQPVRIGLLLSAVVFGGHVHAWRGASYHACRQGLDSR